jgi:hypothetical protein
MEREKISKKELYKKMESIKKKLAKILNNYELTQKYEELINVAYTATSEAYMEIKKIKEKQQ